jgi:hypothetical protein
MGVKVTSAGTCAAAAVLLLAWGSVIPARAADPCDRACLEGHIDKVLAAMIAHDPGQLMLARDARYTENGVELALGRSWVSVLESWSRSRRRGTWCSGIRTFTSS